MQPGGRIGVLALQGDVPEHQRALRAAGAEAARVRRAGELADLDGLVIPGGESSTVGMLLERFGLLEPLLARIAAGLPVFGTCTGIILLAREIEGSTQPRLGCMDLTVRRNAYGRQVDSFETTVVAPAVGADPLRAVFIRAPQVVRAGPGVETLAATADGPVLVREGRLLGATFHPELTDDLRVHQYFLGMAGDS
jgi:5'-phosphate synthase pdxT subunit